MKGLVDFARDFLGLTLHPGQAAILDEWEASGKNKAVFCLGRRSGKGVLAQIAAIYNATQMDYSKYLRPGHPRYIIVVATSREQAVKFILETKVTLKRARSRDLYDSVVWDECTASKIVFETPEGPVLLEAMATSDRSTRGMAASMLIFDEAGHLAADSASVGAGGDLYQALLPSMTQFKNQAYVLFTSTPMLRLGVFWDVYRQGTELGEDGQPIDPTVHVVQRATWEVANGDGIPYSPRITRDGDPEIVNAFRVNPEWAAVEYGANFMAAGGAFLDPEDIVACQRKEGILPPEAHQYSAAIDPAFQRDAFTLAIAHKVSDGKVIIDGVWSWGAGSGYDRTLDEVAEVLREYGIRKVRTDQFSSQPVIEGLAKRRIHCDAVPWDNANKWEAFSRLKAGLRTRQVQLPRDQRTEAELMNLMATATATGLVRISASGTFHDDRAVVVAALMDLLENELGPIVIDRSMYAAPENIWEAWGDDALLPDIA